MKYIVTREEPYEGGVPMGVFDHYDTARKAVIAEMSKKDFCGVLAIYNVEENVLRDDLEDEFEMFEKDEYGTITSDSR